MRERDLYTDLCRIEHEKAKVLTSTARFFEILAEERQDPQQTVGMLGGLVADIMVLGSNLGLEYDIMYAKINEELKIRAMTAR